MLESGSSVVGVAAVLLVCVSTGAWAQWIQNGTGLCTAANHQDEPAIVSDGAGGAIVTWNEFRGGTDNDIYAQRVNATGAVQWAANGVALCTAAWSQESPVIVSDGAGGAIVAWHDNRSGNKDIYAQRVDGSGTVQWTADGVALCSAANDQLEPTIVSDGAGGAIVAWHDNRSGTNYDIYAQHVNATGAVQWAADGVALCTAGNSQVAPTIVSDGAGGAIVTWYDYRSGMGDIYTQRVNATGAVQWAADGVALCTATYDQLEPTIVSDGAGGAIVTWYDYRSGMADIYTQRVNVTGVVLWTTDGVALCTAANNQFAPTIVSDGVGGAIVTWYDLRSVTNYDIYTQHVNATGAVLWTADGVALCTAANSQFAPTIVSDGVGGAIVTWYDFRSGTNNDIYAQRVNVNGAVQWAADGVALCTAENSQFAPTIVSDGAGGAIVTWHDYRSGTGDIYAQRVTRQGYWGYPSPSISSVEDLSGDQGGRVRINFVASRLDAWPDLGVTRYSVWRSLSEAAAHAMETKGLRLESPDQVRRDMAGRAYYSSATANWEYVGELEAHLWTDYAYTATTLRDSTSAGTGWETYRISAHGSGPFDFWNSASDSGYSVDNLPPGPPAALAGQYTGGSQLWLHWNPNTETDLDYYAVYRGTFPDFVPSEINRLGIPPDTSFTDTGFGPGEEYYYKVSAFDVHENESEHALLTPDDVTGVPGGEPSHVNALFQNVPNPFGSGTQIAFSLEKAGRVGLKIFDARGRLVRELVDEERAPSRYVEVWDGRDGRGRSVAAGTYFCRLELPGWSAVKKMTFAK